MTTVDLLERFISFPTISANPTTDFVHELAERAEKQGARVHRLQTSPTKENLLLQFGEASSDGICLCGHMDVVPVSDQEWHTDPFKAEIKGNRLYGRGACDMKGFFAAVYSVLEELPLYKLKKGITLAFTHDEEVGCVGANHMIEQLNEFDLPIPRAMLIGEPTGIDICHHHGGHSTIVITIKGRAAHSSKPNLGLSANEWLLRCWLILREWEQWLQTQVCQVSESAPIINIAQIHGGEAINIVPENAEIHVGIRPMPEHNIHELLAPLYQMLRPIQEEINNLDGSISILEKQHAHPMLTKLPTPLETAIRVEYPQTQTIGVPFATDGGIFAQQGCSPIICGPGSIDVAHQPNEYIEISELLRYQNLLGALLQKWCF